MQLKVVGGVLVGAAVVAAGGVIAQADSKKQATSGNGLAVTSGLIERTATAGGTNEVLVQNRSKEALAVAVAARPWRQSSSGVVAPNRNSTLRDVEVSETAFTLAPGTEKKLTVTLKTATSQYGALEVVGLPTNIAKRKGIIPGYRIVSALRYKPATASYGLKVGAAKIKADMLTLSVKSTGNTAEQVSGNVRLKGPLGTRQSSIKAVRVLPGTTLALPVVSTRGLSAGSYTATVSLKQGSFKSTVTKKISVKR